MDWLLEKIKEYLENVTISTEDDVKKLVLEYLRICDELNYQKARQSILAKVNYPFPRLQTYKEFTLLRRWTQISIAIERLFKLKQTKGVVKNDLFSVYKNFESDKC